MKIYRDISDYHKGKFPVVSVGTFDGVHLGHQMIIRRMKEIAAENDGETVIITFEPHPRMVLYQDSRDLKLINSPKRKTDLLRKTRIDHLIVINFTLDFAGMSSEEFIRKVIADEVGARYIVVGYDHHFGKDRSGSLQNLIDIGRKSGFRVEEVPAYYVNDVPVSSSKIRTALNEGDIQLANQYLGYIYSIHGTVIPGYKIGREIGFPTANIEVDDKLKLITANGVYACKIRWRGKGFLGMGNIGMRPTLNRKDLSIEVHIFDFDHEIYGDPITVYWIDRIRDEIKFRDIYALRDQLFRDKEKVLKLLSK